MAAAPAAPQAPAPRAQKQSDAPKASQSSSSSTSQTSSAAPKKSHDVAKKAGILAILGSMGPGILTAFAGNDAGGIATYSTTGASYGYGMLWTVPLMCLLLIVVQETSARMGCATGKGFASLIREQFGVRISALAMIALIISNFAVTLSEFAGIASGMQLDENVHKLEGESVMGAENHAEFNVDETALYELILEIFYEPIDG